MDCWTCIRLHVITSRSIGNRFFVLLSLIVFYNRKRNITILQFECLITDASHCSFSNAKLISCNSTSAAVNKSLQICYHARSLLAAVLNIQKRRYFFCMIRLYFWYLNLTAVENCNNNPVRIRWTNISIKFNLTNNIFPQPYKNFLKVKKCTVQNTLQFSTKEHSWCNPLWLNPLSRDD